MKRGKVVSMPNSTETQIRTRARNLPVDRCYVNDNWEKAQIVNVVVTRKHTNGNISYGVYLVDLLLLGVKDCFYAFNQSPMELKDRLFNGAINFVECDYVLAHNIVYEGIAFADEYGFEPVKEFTRTGKYILEEDSDDIPEMDIPVGKDGVPVVSVTSDENRSYEITTLDKTAGPGNYIND